LSAGAGITLDAVWPAQPRIVLFVFSRGATSVAFQHQESGAESYYNNDDDAGTDTCVIAGVALV